MPKVKGLMSKLQLKPKAAGYIKVKVIPFQCMLFCMFVRILIRIGHPKSGDAKLCVNSYALNLINLKSWILCHPGAETMLQQPARAWPFPRV